VVICIGVERMSFVKKTLIVSLVILYSFYLVGSSIILYGTYNVTKKTDNEFRDFYVQFGFNKDQHAMILDKNNVTFVDYSKIKSLGVKNTISYNPVTIGLQGMRYFQKYKREGDHNNFNIFISHAKWLAKNINIDGAWIFSHDKKIGKYNLRAPWVSSLSQGLGISVLTRAYHETNDEMYLASARKALKPFNKNIREGGVTTTNSFGNFYEEYPLKENPTHVLNGFISSLFGLYDLYLYDNNKEAKRLFDQGIETLKNILPLYDLGCWTRYDLNKKRNLRNHWGYASPWYQKLHIAQIYGLYLVTKENIFLQYSKKFEEQERYSWINYIIYPAYVIYTDFVKVVRFIQS